jgi:hypothetical protein
VEAAPELRNPPSAPLARFDDIMEALKQLDGEVAQSPQYGKFINRARRLRDLYRRERPPLHSPRSQRSSPAHALDRGDRA